MSYKRLIHDYLDVGLDDNMQASLFNELALNSELRSEFNRQMKIHLIAKENFDNIAPPTDLTNKVFTNAGFSAPFASLPGFKFEYLVGLLPVLLILFAISNFIDLDNIIDNANFTKNELVKNDLESKKSGKQQVNNSINSNIPISSASSEGSVENLSVDKYENNNFQKNESNALGNNSNNKTNLSGISQRNSSFNSKDNSNNVANFSVDNGEGISYLYEKDMDYAGKPHFIISTSSIERNLVSITRRDENNNLQNIEAVRTLIITPENSNNSLINLGHDNTTMAFNVKGIKNSSLYRNIQNVNMPTMNFAVSFIYKFHDKWSFITEYSRENYFQEFQNVNKQGLNFITRQNPELDLLSIGFRYTAKELFETDVIYPFAQVNFGYSTIGPVGKFVAGVEYRINNSISLIPSYDLSGLLYANQFGTYLSNNQGFSLGMSYNFNER